MSSIKPTPRVKDTVFRVRGIPDGATMDNLAAAFSEFSSDGITLDLNKTTMCQSCYGDGTQTALVQFTPHAPDILETLPNGKGHGIKYAKHHDIWIDKDFYGLTPLYRTQGIVNAE